MKILSITAGAAGMYCGSCLRDNTLARELLARGHDVLLVPLYTPTRTDEPNVSLDRVFLSGIGVYLEQYVPIFRKTPWALDRWWDSPRLLRAVSRRAVKTDPGQLGELTISTLKGEDGYQRKEIEKLIHWIRSEPLPDLVNLPNSLLIGLARPLRRALDRPIVCTLQGEDLFIDGLGPPYRDRALALIRSAIEHVDAFLAVSEYYAGFMARYLQIPAHKMHVVPLGLNFDGYTLRVPRAPSPEPRGPAVNATLAPSAQRLAPGVFTIGYFARVAPEKGLHVLCEAYRRLRQDRGLSVARLEVAGYLGPEHREYLDEVARRMREWGLDGEFRYHGEVDRQQKIAFLQGLDALSVPCTYDEPKGTFLLEAMAVGVPVVQPDRGSFPEVVAKTGGGLIVRRNDPDALADGLLRIWREPALAARLGADGARGVREHYSAARMANRALAVIEQVCKEIEDRRQNTEDRRT